MAEEKQPLTLEDIKKDNDLMLTIDRYSRDRYNRGYADPDKAVKKTSCQSIVVFRTIP
jgi:hypothetical protein